MSLPDTKALKELVKSCRKVGIKTFKCADFEFTLTEDEPTSNYKKKAKATLFSQVPASEYKVESEDLTPEQLLMWSTGELDKQGTT